MQSSTEQAQNRKAINSRMTQLLRDLENVANQIDETIDEVSRGRLKRKEQRLNLEYEEAGEQLLELDRESSDLNQQYVNLDQALPKIDFDEVMDEMDGLMRQFRRSSGGALLLVQESLLMAGEFCVRRVRDRLDIEPGKLKRLEAAFSFDCCSDQQGLLEQIAGQLNIEITAVTEVLTQIVIDKLCESVPSGGTVFLEIRKWDDVPCQVEVFDWFVHQFWQPLVARLGSLTKVKFIAVIVVDTELLPECLDLPCLLDQKIRFMQLPLRHWTAEDIQIWLESHMELTSSHSERIANRIHRASRGGVPDTVCTALRREFLH